MVKSGAEGVFCGVVPDRGLGIALKVRDGGQRAAETTIEWLLDHLGVIIQPARIGGQLGGNPGW